MDLRRVVTQAAQLLDVPCEEDAGAFVLTVTVSEAENEDEDDRTQLVRVELDDEGEVLLTSTLVGPCEEDADLAEALRVMREALFSRLYLSEATEDEPEQLVVEAAQVFAQVDPEQLASVVQEVAELADEVELLLFDAADDEFEDDEEEDDE